MRVARLSLVAALAACTGDIGSGLPDGVSPDPDLEIACTASTPGASPMRRLTRWEYNNTVLDLLGDATRPADKLDPEASNFGFDNNVDGAVLNVSVVENYETIATAIAARAVVDLPRLLDCDVATTGEEACARSFIATFGKKAFRRPLTTEESQGYEAFLATHLSEFGLSETVGMIVSAMLQSPHFLYRIETLGPDQASAERVALAPYEAATRLSYLLWGTMPDEALFAAAEKGELSTPEQIAAQAQRMLSDEKGDRAIKNFVTQWSSMNKLVNEHRGEDFTPEVATLLTEELTTFADEVVRKGDGKLSTLLTAPYTYMNETLASYYGITGPQGDEMVKVDLDPTRYAGILTQAGFLALKSHEDQHSAVRRGVFVLEQILCSPTPPPPCNADLTLPEVDPNTTSRERLEKKTSVSPCVDCHALINPPGFAFEHFDQTGRWRDTDGALPIDATGQMALNEGPQTFSGPVELAAELAASSRAQACFVDHWFRYAYGRNFGEADQCTREGLASSFAASEGNVRELLVALTQTPTFLYRQGGQ